MTDRYWRYDSFRQVWGMTDHGKKSTYLPMYLMNSCKMALLFWGDFVFVSTHQHLTIFKSTSPMFLFSMMKVAVSLSKPDIFKRAWAASNSSWLCNNEARIVAGLKIWPFSSARLVTCVKLMWAMRVRLYEFEDFFFETRLAMRTNQEVLYP